MNTYELTIVYSGKLTPAKKKELLKGIETLIKISKGTIKETKDWGEIELAYPINKSSIGTFLHFAVELESGLVKDIEEKLRMDTDVVRHLLVRKDK